MKPQPYKVESTPQGYRFRLPNRDTSSFSVAGWGLLGFGAVGCLFMVFWISGPAIGGFTMLAKDKFMGLLMIGFASFGLIGLYQTSRIVTAGWAILNNKLGCEIEIRDKYLTCTEKFGWSSWKRKTLIKNVHRFEVVQLKTTDISPPPDFFGDPEQFGSLNAVGQDDSKSFRIGIGYDQSLLLPLGEELALKLNKIYEPSYSDDAKGITQPVSTIVTTRTEADEELQSRKQPADSKIEVVRKNGSLAFNVPPAGRKGAHGLYGFSIAWLGFTSLISIFLLSSTIFGDDGLLEKEGIWGVLGLCAFLLLFLGAGVGMFLSALNLAKRSVMLGVDKGMLFIERKSIFGTKWIEFEQKDVASIAKGNSGMEINDVPVTELQITNAEGKTQGLLSQLSDAEISWLAHELTEELGVPKPQGDPKSLAQVVEFAKSHPNWPRPPVGKLELVQLDNSSRSISVPAHGIRSQLGPICTGLSFIVAGLTAGCCLFFLVDEWIMALFAIGILGGTGSAFIFFGLNYSTKRYDIVATSDSKNDSIGVLRTGLFREKQFIFSRDSNPKISISTNDLQVNNRMLFSMSLRNKQTKLKLMEGQSLADIRYVAAHLAEWIEEGKAT